VSGARHWESRRGKAKLVVVALSANIVKANQNRTILPKN
jgi:hypothetical protein